MVIVDFSYLGCYYDALSHRILSGLWTVTSTMTTEECVNACMKGNYTHALAEVKPTRNLIELHQCVSTLDL